MNSFVALILSAGTSERMGTPKALLTYSNGVTFIEQIVEKYLEAGTERIVLVINPSLSQIINLMPFCQNHQVMVVENKEPEKGRIHSIKLGMEKLNELPFFIQNVDNPFVTVDLLNRMLPELQPNKYVSPFYKGSGGHPILISHEIALQLKGCDLKTPLNLFLANYEQIKMEQGNSDILVNINTPDDYRAAFK
ncbi:MAG: NTP transferase domain-containing protein [Salinivirgaceae bacterium]